MVGVLQNYARQLAKRTGMQVSVHCFHAEVHLAPALALPLFRIVQEALTNCAKHSRASVVDITLRLTSQPMQLIISDDGIGFDPSAPRRSGSGLGLMNMRETAEFIGGTLNLISGAGAGTTVTASVALAPHERDA